MADDGSLLFAGALKEFTDIGEAEGLLKEGEQICIGDALDAWLEVQNLLRFFYLRAVAFEGMLCQALWDDVQTRLMLGVLRHDMVEHLEVVGAGFDRVALEAVLIDGAVMLVLDVEEIRVG